MAPLTTPYGGIVLGPYLENEPIPDDCVVYGDRDGEWIVLAPEIRRRMRSGCPDCDDDHG
jgi:hypothetical protein